MRWLVAALLVLQAHPDDLLIEYLLGPIDPNVRTQQMRS